MLCVLCFDCFVSASYSAAGSSKAKPWLVPSSCRAYRGQMQPATTLCSARQVEQGCVLNCADSIGSVQDCTIVLGQGILVQLKLAKLRVRYAYAMRMYAPAGHHLQWHCVAAAVAALAVCMTLQLFWHGISWCKAVSVCSLWRHRQAFTCTAVVARHARP